MRFHYQPPWAQNRHRLELYPLRSGVGKKTGAWQTQIISIPTVSCWGRKATHTGMSHALDVCSVRRGKRLGDWEGREGFWENS